MIPEYHENGVESSDPQPPRPKHRNPTRDWRDSYVLSLGSTSKMASFLLADHYNRTSVGASRQALNFAMVRAFFSLLAYEFCLLSSFWNRLYHPALLRFSNVAVGFTSGRNRGSGDRAQTPAGGS